MVGGASGAPSRLAIGSTGAVMHVSAGTPAWTRTPSVDSITVTAVPTAGIALNPVSGGRHYSIFSGGTGSANANALTFYDATGGVTLCYFNAGTDFYLQMWDGSAHLLRRVDAGAANSGGAGFRMLVTPN